MKLFKYGLPFAALAMLASCSNDNIDAPNAGGENLAKDGLVTATFTVTLPSLSDTRAITADDFEDGLESEYKVNDATFYIFKAPEGDANTGEDSYVFIAKSDTFYPGASNDPTEDITRTAEITVQFEEEQSKNFTNSGTYYGLCVINKPTGAFEPTTNQTFGAWRKVATYTYANFKHDGGFTMTNAPTYVTDDVVTAPNETNLRTLTELDGSTFAVSPNKPTGSAGTFYVQRGVAKVAIQGAKVSDGLAEQNDVALSKVPSAVDANQYFNLGFWGLDYTNKNSFPVQNVDNVVEEMAAVSTAEGDPRYFYTTSTGTGAGKIGFNHIWWANDVNYSTATDRNFASDFNKLDANSTLNAVTTTYDYCLENTMPWQSMVQDETTRVLFKGTYSIDGTTPRTFIVAEANDKALHITQDMLIDEENNTYLKEGAIDVDKANNSVKLSDLINTDEYQGADKANFVDYKVDGKVRNLEVVARKLGIQPDKNVAYYPNGITYYVARIKHFDPVNDTPWTAPANATNTSSTTDIYKAKHTGRYGVLRNNVYYISIQRVLGYGSPEVPTPTPDTPDDEIDPVKYNMEVAINILAWAKRNYGYELK